jgi:hypothetical protein
MVNTAVFIVLFHAANGLAVPAAAVAVVVIMVDDDDDNDDDDEEDVPASGADETVWSWWLSLTEPSRWYVWRCPCVW